jgi:hypothetical protein
MMIGHDDIVPDASAASTRYDVLCLRFVLQPVQRSAEPTRRVCVFGLCAAAATG